MTEPGRFIVVEGLDGAGTTTQSALLADWLREQGIPVLLTGEPTDSDFGKLARRMVDSHAPVDPQALALLFAADRREHLHGVGGILALIAEGSWVVCDRYLLSGLAYQAADGVELGDLLAMNGFAPDPDMTIFLDASPEACLSRVGRRGTSSSMYETAARMPAVWDSYRLLSSEGHGLGQLEVVDGNLSIEEVEAHVRRVVGERFLDAPPAS